MDRARFLGTSAGGLLAAPCGGPWTAGSTGCRRGRGFEGWNGILTARLTGAEGHLPGVIQDLGRRGGAESLDLRRELPSPPSRASTDRMIVPLVGVQSERGMFERAIKSCADSLRPIFGWRRRHQVRAFLTGHERLVRTLPHTGFDVLEISGNKWASFGFKSYRDVGYPGYDLCKEPLPKRFDLIVAEQGHGRMGEPSMRDRQSERWRPQLGALHPLEALSPKRS